MSLLRRSRNGNDGKKPLNTTPSVIAHSSVFGKSDRFADEEPIGLAAIDARSRLKNVIGGNTSLNDSATRALPVRNRRTEDFELFGELDRSSITESRFEEMHGNGSHARSTSNALNSNVSSIEMLPSEPMRAQTQKYNSDESSECTTWSSRMPCVCCCKGSCLVFINDCRCGAECKAWLTRDLDFVSFSESYLMNGVMPGFGNDSLKDLIAALAFPMAYNYDMLSNLISYKREGNLQNAVILRALIMYYIYHGCMLCSLDRHFKGAILYDLKSSLVDDFCVSDLFTLETGRCDVATGTSE